MTSTAARPAKYDVPRQQQRPPTPMNTIGEGATPLMYACQQARDQEVRNILAKKPAAVRERDRTLKTALHYCAENSTLTCAEAILSVAPDLVDVRDEDGYTPLHLAVISGNLSLIKFLLAKNADVNSLDFERHSVVHWATVCGEVDALELVLDAGANSSTPDIHGGYPIHYAAQMCGPNSEMGNDVRFGLAVLRVLLARGVDVNVRDKDGRQPILWAASAGSADAILALVNAGANVEADDKDGLTALHCAASRGHTDCLETLITLCGAEVDVIDSNGCTALFYSVTLGHADSTQLLLCHGAEPNRQDRKGRTPAHCGAAKGQLETLRILGQGGANLWVRNVKGDFPLHEAVASGRKDLVRWLLAQRPEAVNAPNNDGRCPLHIAAINNNVEMCKILLDNQALLNAVMRTNKGQLMTPIDAALHRGNRGCAKYLQLHGGVPASKLTEKAASLRGGNQRVAMSETQSEQYTTPELATTLTLSGAGGISPRNVETVRRLDTRTLQVRLNDDVAIRHVERIEAPMTYSRRGIPEDSSGEEERMRRRRQRRRRRTKTQEDDDRGRRRVEFSASEGDIGSDYDSERQRGTRRRRGTGKRGWRERSEDEDENDLEFDNESESAKQRSGKSNKSKRKTKTKEESDESPIEYVKVKRTTVQRKKTKRNKKVAERGKQKEEEEEEKEEEEEETQAEGDSVEERSSVDVEDSRDNSTEKEVITKSTTKSTSKRHTVTATKTKLKHRAKEDSKTTQKLAGKSTKKSASSEVKKKEDKPKTKDTKKSPIKQTSSNSPSSGTKDIEEEENKKIVGKRNRMTAEYSTADVQQKREAYRQSQATVTLEDDEIEATKTVVTALVHQEATSLTSETSLLETKEPLKSGDSAEQGSVTEVKENLVEQEGVDEQDVQNAQKCEEKVSIEQNVEKGDGKLTNEQAVVSGDEELREQQELTPSEVDDKVENESVAQEEQLQATPEREEVAERKENEEIVSPQQVQKTEKTAPQAGKLERIDEEVQKSEETPEEATTEKDDSESSEARTEQTFQESAEIAETVNVSEDVVEEKEMEREEEQSEEDQQKSEAEKESEEQAEIAEQAGVGEEDVEVVQEDEKGMDESGIEDGETDAKTEERESTSELGVDQENDEEEVGRQEVQEDKEDEQELDGDEEDVNQEARDENVDGIFGEEVKEEEGEEYDEEDEEKAEEAEKSKSEESGASTERSRSSVLMDSGFEPSPRRDRARSMSKRRRIPRPCRTDTEEGPPITPVSVTQAVQHSMRKYQLERQIFQELLELKRLQIRAGRANEQVLVKRLVDDYHKAGLTVGLKQYDGVYTFRNFEKYLYEQLRLLQTSDKRIIPRLKSSDDLEKLTSALRRARYNNLVMEDNIPDNPLLCTHGTHRCHHAAHAYTGIPCAAYITKLNHHHMPKSSGSTKSGGFLPHIDTAASSVRSKSSRGEHAPSRSLRYVDPTRPVTLELSHGSERQVISLPTERLDRNKRYYVTFTIKGSGSREEQKDDEESKALRHRHAKSF